MSAFLLLIHISSTLWRPIIFATLSGFQRMMAQLIFYCFSSNGAVNFELRCNFECNEQRQFSKYKIYLIVLTQVAQRAMVEWSERFIVEVVNLSSFPAISKVFLSLGIW